MANINLGNIILEIKDDKLIAHLPHVSQKVRLTKNSAKQIAGEIQKRIEAGAYKDD